MLTVIWYDTLTPFREQVIVTVVLAVTDLVVTVKVALVAPAGMVTVVGAVATAVLLDVIEMV